MQTTEEKLHVFFVASWYPSKVHPTLGNFCQQHAIALAGLHKVSVLSIHSDEKASKTTLEITKKGSLTEYRYYYPKVQSTHLFSSFVRFFLVLNCYLKGRSKIQKEHGKIAITHLNVAQPLGICVLISKFIHRSRYLLTEHASSYTHAQFHPSWMLRKIVKNATVVAPVSDYLAKNMLQHFPDLKYSTIGNTINCSIFKPHLQASKNNTFLHISTGDFASKNVFGILEAVKKLTFSNTHFQLKIICDGDTKLLNEKCRELNLLNSFVFFEATKNSEDIAKTIQESTATILFSNYETFGIVAIESLACGVPVIATRIPVFESLISSQEGILVTPKATTELADAMQSVLDNTPHFNADVLRSKALVFDYSVIATEFTALYTTLLRN